eukprot:NODE_1614_length_793_cov_39.782282_g1565_i0.p1 GENE.NODE_1614_length_793_cov_39.782282_g1565_i0~~NODE_1614_length_793_cov_39.782282_g1565_i0.p1  ORF type:complete len:175 (-),score=7.32 NODE_1614_length_793_cov_39.782282_g1565_i0:4-528(-)
MVQHSKMVYLYQRTDESALLSHLGDLRVTPPQSFELDCSTHWSMFMSDLLRVRDVVVPSRQMTTSDWIDGRTQRLVAIQNRRRREWLANQNYSTFMEYKLARKNAKAHIRKRKRQLAYRFVLSASSSSSRFWSFYRRTKPQDLLVPEMDFFHHLSNMLSRGSRVVLAPTPCTLR